MHQSEFVTQARMPIYQMAFTSIYTWLTHPLTSAAPGGSCLVQREEEETHPLGSCACSPNSQTHPEMPFTVIQGFWFKHALWMSCTGVCCQQQATKTLTVA